jgi:hypothetical protein
MYQSMHTIGFISKLSLKYSLHTKKDIIFFSKFGCIYKLGLGSFCYGAPLGWWERTRKNNSASTLFPHRRRPLRWRLRGDGNGSFVFSPFFRFGKICFSVCRWRSSLATTTMAAEARWFLWNEDIDRRW